MEKRHLHTLFSRFFGNDFPKEVRNRFATWFIREEQADEKEEVLEDIWNSLPETIDFTSYAELKKVNKRIHPEKNSFYRRLAVIAAIIVLPLLGIVTTTWYYKYAGISSDMHMVECFVPNGERKQVILPDGSIVWLNANSVLIYPEKFGKTRTLFLSGEGHFTVTKDKERPFIVKTKEMDVQVLGTSFNVMAYETDESSSVVLVTGAVQVDTKDDEDFRLEPNRMFSYYQGECDIKEVNVNDYILWKDGLYTYRSEHLSVILDRLSRYYGKKISYKFDVADLKCSGKLDMQEDLEVVLDGLSQTAPILYKKIDEEYIVVKEGK